MIEILTHHISPITAITFSDKYIAVARGQFIEIWDIIQSKPIKVIKNENIITNLSIAIGNTKLLVISGNQIKTLNIITGELIQTLTIHNSSITAMALSDKYLITSDKDCIILIWDFTKNKFTKIQDDEVINYIQIIDNKEFITSTKNDTKKLWDLKKLKLLNKSKNNSWITELITIDNKNYAFTSNGKFLYFRDIDENEQIFQPPQNLLYKIATNRNKLYTMKIDEEYHFVSIDKNNIIYLWNINKKALIKQFVLFNDGGWLYIDTITQKINGSKNSNKYLRRTDENLIK